MLIFNSCVSEEEPFTAPVSDSQLAVEDARAWLGPQEEFEVPITSAVNARAKTRTEKIQWNKEITHDNGRIIEVAVKYSVHGVPMTGDTTKVLLKQKQKNSFYRLLIRKDSLGNCIKSLLKYFPEQHVDGQSKLEVNNFMSLSPQFSGDIQLTDREENLEMGWRVKNGNVFQQYLPAIVFNKKTNTTAGVALNCVPVTEEVCENTIYPSPPGTLDEIEVRCYFVTYNLGLGCGNVSPRSPGIPG